MKIEKVCKESQIHSSSKGEAALCTVTGIWRAVTSDMLTVSHAPRPVPQVCPVFEGRVIQDHGERHGGMGIGHFSDAYDINTLRTLLSTEMIDW